jgi:hypothetical protein
LRNPPAFWWANQIHDICEMRSNRWRGIVAPPYPVTPPSNSAGTQGLGLQQPIRGVANE